ncbi:Nuclease-related domain-containing protein [Paraburkholderia steynii]|uniref:Nuclease-related domain-containing protein n=1 Tax=Paraburkholderia steynii TaxID=1245441 RepID=A0A7Z7B5K7_9BURK|nr:ATP-dependent helicase [Paraburkholderia steynii]SDH55334.1 Nuclease-related domain-containing protein [Paraburkholderia steynii]
MAQVFPGGWNDRLVSGAAKREIETLGVLQRGLPDSYSVYHGVHWTQLNKGFSIFGEADFVIVSPAGRVLVIEQKSGALEETPDGLTKLYAGKSKSVSSQIARTIGGMHGRFKDAFGAQKYKLEEMLYCPDYRVKFPAISGVNPERIVDAARKDKLVSIVEAILPTDEPPLPCRGRIHAFLADELSLTPDVRAMIGEVTRFVTRVSGGLATWARSIEFEPFRLRVIGTAGSGKTQLAIRVLDDVVNGGRRALYLCFNRPLADHLRSIVPAGATVLTYHQLCQHAAARLGHAIDFADDHVFASLERALRDWQPDDAERFDTVIVDEGQDFRQEWVVPIERLLRKNGRFWWLEDPMQNLYLRKSVELPRWVEVRAMANHRSPHDVVRFIGMLSGAPMAIEAAGPFTESDVSLTTYTDGGAMQATRDALDQAAAAGFSASDIALLTFHGRDKSLLPVLDRLGRYALRGFTGAYDEHGAPVYRDGDITVETVYRFKGQSAPCVVLTEVDFEQFDDATFRRLFVGATRATMKLFIVMSERAAASLLERMR